MKKTKKQTMCEQATGCYQQNELVYYNDSGEIVLTEQATILLRDNQPIEIPAAGAGNFEEVFTSLGFSEVKVIDWTSSAGDWTFGVKNEDGWFIGTQEHRYPLQGYRYMISDIILCCDTFEQLCENMEYI